MTRVPDEYRMSCLLVLPWSEPRWEDGGYDPRSDYVEQFWLPLMGPSAVLVLRRLAMGLDRWPDGFECSTRELSMSLGLGSLGSQGRLGLAIRRTAEFGMTTMEAGGQLLVRRLLPPVPKRMEHRLPVWLQGAHRTFPRTELLTSGA